VQQFRVIGRLETPVEQWAISSVQFSGDGKRVFAFQHQGSMVEKLEIYDVSRVVK
jgi:hypothetical protein